MNDVIPIRPVKGIKITPENKCSYCRGSTCCTYVTQAIDTPRGMEDFDVLLWQIAHPNVEVYKDEDGWFLMFTATPCSFLLPGGRCGIYEHRPQICRDHDNDGCEFEGQAGHDDFELYFQTYESLDQWCRKRFKSWDRRFSSNNLKNKKKPAVPARRVKPGASVRKRA
jgi:hypothetical protein